MNSFCLKDHKLEVAELHHNFSPSSHYEHAIRFEKDASIAENGALGTGKRISLKHTRAIIDAIHGGALAKAKTQCDPFFGFEVATECPGVPTEILLPRSAWADKKAYDAAAKQLAGLFKENFKTYEAGASAAVKAAGPA